jgi:hypothetical protein
LLNAVANKREYLERSKLAVEHLHQCSAVHETFRGQTVWQGEVEVFDITGHPKANRAYAWNHREGPNDEGERFVAVLEIPPVQDAQSAVKVAIVARAKGGK